MAQQTIDRIKGFQEHPFCMFVGFAVKQTTRGFNNVHTDIDIDFGMSMSIGIGMVMGYLTFHRSLRTNIELRLECLWFYLIRVL